GTAVMLKLLKFWIDGGVVRIPPKPDTVKISELPCGIVRLACAAAQVVIVPPRLSQTRTCTVAVPPSITPGIVATVAFHQPAAAPVRKSERPPLTAETACKLLAGAPFVLAQSSAVN